MLYIDKKYRKRYEEAIESIANNLPTVDFAGHLNYVISSIIGRITEDNMKYAVVNEIMGALECIKQEFYRRKVAPYEDLKIRINGDINE